MSESSGSAFSLIESFYLLPLYSLVACNDHLCNSLSVVDYKFLVAEVYEDDTDFSSIVGVDSAWGVQYGYPVLDSESAPWPDLCLKSLW